MDTLEYQFKDVHDNATHVTYEYASGDKSGTANDEQFDGLWGRWPRWSELFIFTYANETRVGDMSNLHRANIGHRINFTKQWQLTGDYHALWADQNSGGGSGSLARSTDKRFRGSLYATSLRYKMSDQLSGYGLFEYLVPGSYYVGAERRRCLVLPVQLRVHVLTSPDGSGEEHRVPGFSGDFFLGAAS